MALKTLSNSGIANGSPILPGQVTQSVDAFTGAEGYAITLSGSFEFAGATTGSGWFQNSVSSSRAESASITVTALTSSVAQSVKVTNNATTNQNYRLLFAAESSLPNPNADGYAQPRFDSGSDGSGLYYNPSTNTLYAPKISGSNDGSTPDFYGTASYANYANVAATATTATNVTFTYIGIDDVTYSSSAGAYPVNSNTPYNVYVSQSQGTSYELSLAFGTGNNGQIVNFTPDWKQSGYLSIAGGGQPTISVTSSIGISVYGINSNTLGPNSSAFLNTLGVNTPRNLTFQYVSTPSGTIFPAVGWYLININEN